MAVSNHFISNII